LKSAVQMFQSYSRYKLIHPYFHKIKTYNSNHVETKSIKIHWCARSQPGHYTPEVCCMLWCWSCVWYQLKSLYFIQIKANNCINVQTEWIKNSQMHMFTPWTIYHWSFKSVVLTVSELRVMQTFQDRWKYRWNYGWTDIRTKTNLHVYPPVFKSGGLISS